MKCITVYHLDIIVPKVYHLVNTLRIKKGGNMPSKKPQILIRTTEENKKKIEAIAEEQKRSVSNLMEVIIEEYLRKYEANNKSVDKLTQKQKELKNLIDMKSISE